MAVALQIGHIPELGLRDFEINKQQNFLEKSVSNRSAVFVYNFMKLVRRLE